MDELIAFLFSAGMVLAILEAAIVGIVLNSPGIGLGVLAGAVVGSITPLFIYRISPKIYFQIALWSNGGKDLFGSTQFLSAILLILMVLLGSGLGGWIGLKISLKFYSG
jgi:hypothetical protein